MRIESRARLRMVGGTELPTGDPSAPSIEPCLPLAMRPPTSRDERVATCGAAVCAVCMHFSLLAWFIFAPPPNELGAGGQHLEAINVTIVPTQVLESSEQNRAEKDSAAAATAAPQAGDQTQSPNAESKIEEHTPSATRSAERPQVDSEATPAPKPETEKPIVSQQPVGGETTRGEDSKAPSTSIASASPGAVQHYAALVRAALAKQKPSAQGARGTATVAFAISVSGQLAYARLTHTSGNSRFDTAVLEALQRVTFPKAPENLTEGQRTFIVPFRLK